VVALEPGGKVPSDGRLTLADGSEREATRLDGDGEFGLAVYALAGAPSTGLVPAGSAVIARGRLTVSAGGGEPALHVLGEVGGPLEDVLLPHGSGPVLLAPNGALLGLGSSWGSAAGNCATCHEAASPQLVQRVVTARRQPGAALAEPPAASPTLVELATRMRSSAAARWRRAYTQPADPWHAEWPAEASVVPGPVIERALADVANGGRFGRAYLGVVVQEEAPTSALVYLAPQRALRLRTSMNDLTGDANAWVSNWPHTWLHGSAHAPTSMRLSSVLPDSPAAKAELTAGLEILEVDGRPFRGAQGFARALARRRPGEEVRLLVKGWAEPVRVVLADREKDGRDLATAATVGLSVQGLSPDLLTFFELSPGTQGVLVRQVEAGSPAALAGIERGDVLLSEGQNQAPLRDPGELDAILGTAKGAVLIHGRRGEQRITFTLTMPDRVTPRKTR
jgi:S1-C subfamily serine protease